MYIGKIIYYHRKNQNKTQKELCKDICSITHLSKIENNSKEGNPKTLQLLFERLGVTNEDENKKILSLKQQLDQFYDAIERLHRERAESLYKELIIHEEYIFCTEMIYIYKLYMLRYLLFLNNFSDFETVSVAMKKDITKYSPFERYLWDFIQAVYLGQKQEYLQGLEILEPLEEMAEQSAEKITDYYYYRSVMHGSLKNHSLSIHFAYKALSIFQNTGNTFRILHVKITLALNLIYINEFEKAEKILIPILSDVDLLQQWETKAITLHNLGFLYYRKGELDLATEYYWQSLHLKEKFSVSYYSTIIEIIQIKIDLEQNEEAIKLLKQELGDFQDQKSPKYIELMVLYLQSNKNKKKLTKYLIKHGLPTMEQNKNYLVAIKYADMIVSYYKEIGDLSSTNFYLHESNKLLKNLLLNTIEFE
ncbi:helix-turn-helix domain-containing protein [Gottfriedia sp. NPDC057991]|uniref:helix-turn-helix domain-containing protein n=1 Tax=Gottfriedia sp. NPDC057991 TaxID=3346298 RepID=UPI0036DFA25D